MKVWIDQDLCTGDGLCEEIAPDVFVLLDDGLAYVREGEKIFAAAEGNEEGATGLASIPDIWLSGPRIDSLSATMKPATASVPSQSIGGPRP